MTISEEERQQWKDAATRARQRDIKTLTDAFGSHPISDTTRSALSRIAWEIRADQTRALAADIRALWDSAGREDSDQDQQPKTMGDLQEGDIVTSRLGKRVWHHTVLRTAPGPYGVVTIYFSETFHWVVPVQQAVEARRPATAESEHTNG